MKTSCKLCGRTIKKPVITVRIDTNGFYDQSPVHSKCLTEMWKWAKQQWPERENAK